jgi:hypothetical protein
MLLQGRTDDPEEILKSLGFVNTEEADNPIERIPERFIVDKSGTADGVSITEVLSDNPELTKFLQAISDQQQEGTDNLDMQQANLDAMMAGQGKLSPFLYLTFQVLKLLLYSVPVHFINIKRIAELQQCKESTIEMPNYFISFLLTKIDQITESMEQLDKDLPSGSKTSKAQFIQSKKGRRKTGTSREMGLIETDTESPCTTSYKEQLRYSNNSEEFRNSNDNRLSAQRPDTLQISGGLHTLQFDSFRSLSSADTPSPTLHFRCRLSSEDSL